MAYYKPTPVKWRKIGDAILLGTASMSAMMMGAPLSETSKTWAIFILNIIGVAGKVLTNFFKEDETTTNNTDSNTPT
jgi:hypothetical protein